VGAAQVDGGVRRPLTTSLRYNVSLNAFAVMENIISIRNEGSGESSLDVKSEVFLRRTRSHQSLSLANILHQIPSLAEVSSKLAEGQSYKAYIPPEVLKRLREGSARLAERDNGTLAANILDSNTGEIVANASLVEVSPELVGSLAQLAIQQALADIAYRLEVISEKISAVPPLPGKMTPLHPVRFNHQGA